MPTNALLHEKSPYLRQHAENPVAWLPWGEDAFNRAREENKPIFLSVGYSTCHWCHVMAHESFEDARVAEVLNRDFISVKVDREERPDVDRIYMLFVQASTGSGGWPMSVWLTPDRMPFYGGTYFPPDSRYGRPGFIDVLQHLAQAWKNERARIEESGAQVVEQLRAVSAGSTQNAQIPGRELFEMAYQQFRRMFDSQWGGFGAAPKFPRPVVLHYLLRYHFDNPHSEALEMVTTTLRAMASGGMHDQLGGGFHRYSVDEQWHVPHFEKMLYDQAQLATAYLEAFQISGEKEFADTAHDIFAYVLRDLTSEAGAFYSAEDADSSDPENPSHSGEGAFYIWRHGEIEKLLGKAEAELFSLRYGVSAQGNVEQDPHGEFTGRNILYRAVSVEEVAQRFGLSLAETEERLNRSREVLLQERGNRPRPHLDRKILTSWNSLMISALAKGFIVLGQDAYLQAAEGAADFLLETLYRSDKRQLLRRYCDGEAAIDGFVDDYAFLIQGLLDLFVANGNPVYLHRAVEMARESLRRFEDSEQGGFFSTLADTPDLVLRMKDDYDGAEPSGNSVAVDVLLRLTEITGDAQFRAHAEKALTAFAPRMRAQPTMAPLMVSTLGRSVTEPEQVIFRCREKNEKLGKLLTDYRKAFRPYALVLAIDDATAASLKSTAPFLADLEAPGSITLYECRNFTCQLPKVIA
jgi:hypothetical protein